MTGWLPFEKLVEIYQLDTEQTDAQGHYDPDLRETIPVDPDEDGVPEDPRVEVGTPVTIRAGVERDREALMQMTTGGNVQDTAVVLSIATYRLTSAGLFDANGFPTIRVNDRLNKIMDLNGNPVNVFNGNPLPEVFCRRVTPGQADLGGTTNCWLFLFEERPKG
ncbi:MAG: hypothetical protein GTN69_06935 [Armatimonadetes bacterium]|nr:hypothetical protein [Armatimonadota bacterium]